jgi:hypothetical protein
MDRVLPASLHKAFSYFLFDVIYPLEKYVTPTVVLGEARPRSFRQVQFAFGCSTYLMLNLFNPPLYIPPAKSSSNFKNLDGKTLRRNRSRY